MQQDFYRGKRIDVAVQSTFAGLRSFIDQMAKYQRIVSISNFEIKQLDKQQPNKSLEVLQQGRSMVDASPDLDPQS